jgi:hypothetical protein
MLGFFGRTLGGAALGGVMGGMATGSLSGVGTGAAFGAGTGAFGGAIGRRAMANRGSISGGLARAVDLPGELAMRGAMKLNNRRLFDASWGLTKKLDRASSFIGRNEMTINKVGGTALLGMGAAASSYIGASAISSNRPFGLNR